LNAPLLLGLGLKPSDALLIRSRQQPKPKTKHPKPGKNQNSGFSANC
jgi:hypothetical protein